MIDNPDIMYIYPNTKIKDKSGFIAIATYNSKNFFVSASPNLERLYTVTIDDFVQRILDSFTKKELSKVKAIENINPSVGQGFDHILYIFPRVLDKNSLDDLHKKLTEEKFYLKKIDYKETNAIFFQKRFGVAFPTYYDGEKAIYFKPASTQGGKLAVNHIK